VRFDAVVDFQTMKSSLICQRRRGRIPTIVSLAGTVAAALCVAAVRAEPDSLLQQPACPAASAAPEASLPPHALLRLGTDDLRIRNSFITGIAFSPDGRLVACGEANATVPTVSLFEIRTGRLVKRLSAPDETRGWVQCVAIAPDQAKLAWGEIGGQFAFWDLVHDRLVFREQVHRGAVSDVRFSPDGQIIATGGEDGAVYVRQSGDPHVVVHDLATGEQQPVRRGYTARPSPVPVGPLFLAFTPDGANLVVGSGSSATISIWRVKDGQLLRRIERAHGEPRATEASLTSAAVTPDGRHILSGGESTMPIAQTTIKYGARNVAVSELRLWEFESGTRLKDLQSGDVNGRGYVALSRDGRHLAVGDFGMLRILDAATGRLEQTIALPGCSGARPAFSPDGTLVVMPIHATLGVFEVSTGRRLHHNEQTPEGEWASGAWSPAGDRIVTGHTDGGVRVWDAATGKLLWHKVLAPVLSSSGWSARSAFVGFSGNGRRLVVAGRRDDPVNYRNGVVAVYEATRGLLVRKADLKEVRWAALAPDGKLLVIATSNGGWDDVHLLGIEVETLRTQWTNPPDAELGGFVQIAGMHFDTDSSSFVVATRDSNVIRFEAQTGREQRRFLADGRMPEQAGRPRNPEMYTARFSADNGTMAASSGEWICVWDVPSGTLRRRIRYPDPHGCAIALTHDGKTIATSDLGYHGEIGDDTIRLYDAETGEEILTRHPVDDRAADMAFSPDGLKLLTGLRRGSGLVWDVQRGKETKE
jgi:WD40 repeat protein